MIPGPTIIRKCSACKKQFAELTIMSGNTCGVRIWTDGKMDAPMLPDRPWLVKCNYCNRLLWIDEQEQVGETGPFEITGILSLGQPSLEDYLFELSEPIEDSEKERYVRIRAWWAGNDPRRKAGKTKPMSEKEMVNLRELLSFLDEENENDRIMKAEVFRELGMFNEATSIILGVNRDDVGQAVVIIKKLVEKRIVVVEEITFQ